MPPASVIPCTTRDGLQPKRRTSYSRGQSDLGLAIQSGLHVRLHRFSNVAQELYCIYNPGRDLRNEPEKRRVLFAEFYC